MFQSYLSEYSILEVETFQEVFPFDRAICISKEKGMAICGSAETGHQNSIFFSNFHFFFTCMGDPPRGDRQC